MSYSSGVCRCSYIAACTFPVWSVSRGKVNVFVICKVRKLIKSYKVISFSLIIGFVLRVLHRPEYDFCTGRETPFAQREHIEYFINQTSHYTDKKWGGLEEVVAETNALRDSYTTENDLAPRVQYLQQYYPKTIAYINDKLENYKN